MTVDDKFSLFGAGGLFSDGFFLGQLGVFALTLLLFAGAVALCVMAMRAAATARQAHSAALDLHASVERQASQMQLLSADVERVARDMAARQDEMTAHYRAASPRTEETLQSETAVPAANKPVRRAFANAGVDLESDEPEVKRPTGLLRGLLRRR